MNETIRKVSRHVNQNEGLIFEKSSPGKRAFELPPLDVPAAEPAKALGAHHRKEGVEGFPEVSEIEVLRHFTRLSTWNHAIDLGMYPLGSCTMKYNPRVNEFVARLEGIATEHPYQPQELSQGCLRILRLLEQCLLEITGMDAITLQPAAGAQGELTGLLLIRAYLQKQGNPRKRVLIPDSAHGTNPATAVIAGYAVAMKKILEPFRPVPILAEKEGGRLALEPVRPDSIGKVKAFSSNFGVLVRALAYILAYGPGVRQATEDAVLNANYIRKQLEGF